MFQVDALLTTKETVQVWQDSVIRAVQVKLHTALSLRKIELVNIAV